MDDLASADVRPNLELGFAGGRGWTRGVGGGLRGGVKNGMYGGGTAERQHKRWVMANAFRGRGGCRGVGLSGGWGSRCADKPYF